MKRLKVYEKIKKSVIGRLWKISLLLMDQKIETMITHHNTRRKVLTLHLKLIGIVSFHFIS